MQRSHRCRCTLPAAAPKFDFNSPNSAMGDFDFDFDLARFGAISTIGTAIGSDRMRCGSRLCVFGCLAPRLARAFPPCESRYRRAQLASIGQPRRCARAGALRVGRVFSCSFLLDPLLLLLLLPLSLSSAIRFCLLPSIHPSIHHFITRSCSRLLPKLARTPSSTASIPTRHHVERRCCARTAVRRRACRRTTRIRIHRPTLWRLADLQEGPGICIGRHPPPAAPNLGSRRGCRG